MSATNYLENSVLKLLFNSAPITGLATNATVAPVGTYYLSLHMSDPGEDGTQTTNEANYTGYGRAAVTRDTSGWIVTNATVQNATVVDFPTSVGGSSVVTHFGIGTDVIGSGTLLFSGPLATSLSVTNNTTPSFNAGNLTITVD